MNYDLYTPAKSISQLIERTVNEFVFINKNDKDKVSFEANIVFDFKNKLVKLYSLDVDYVMAKEDDYIVSYYSINKLKEISEYIMSINSIRIIDERIYVDMEYNVDQVYEVINFYDQEECEFDLNIPDDVLSRILSDHGDSIYLEICFENGELKISEYDMECIYNTSKLSLSMSKDFVDIFNDIISLNEEYLKYKLAYIPIGLENESISLDELAQDYKILSSKDLIENVFKDDYPICSDDTKLYISIPSSFYKLHRTITGYYPITSHLSNKINSGNYNTHYKSSIGIEKIASLFSKADPDYYKNGYNYSNLYTADVNNIYNYVDMYQLILKYFPSISKSNISLLNFDLELDLRIPKEELYTVVSEPEYGNHILVFGRDSGKNYAHFVLYMDKIVSVDKNLFLSDISNFYNELLSAINMI